MSKRVAFPNRAMILLHQICLKLFCFLKFVSKEQAVAISAFYALFVFKSNTKPRTQNGVNIYDKRR